MSEIQPGIGVTLEKHPCQHEGCDSTDTVQCRIVDYSGDEIKEDIYWYCPEHCHAEGFCYMCGEFWGGCEEFDFEPSGLCPNCKSEQEAEFESEEEDEPGWWNEDDQIP